MSSTDNRGRRDNPQQSDQSVVGPSGHASANRGPTPPWQPPSPPPPVPYYRNPPQRGDGRWTPWPGRAVPDPRTPASPHVGPGAYPSPDPFANDPYHGPYTPATTVSGPPSRWAPTHRPGQAAGGGALPPLLGWSGAPAYPPFPPPARHSRNRWLWLGAAAAVIVAAVVGLVVWLVWPAATPATMALTELDDGVLIGYPNVPTTIDIFDEPLCPHCGRFVTSSAVDIERAVNAKKIAVRYHLLNFLDNDSPSHDYSTRAVAASYCVAASGDAKTYTNFYVDLFAANFQPPMAAPRDHTDPDLADLARSVGATNAAACIQSGQLIDTAKTKAAGAWDKLKTLDPQAGTPHVYNGTTDVDISAPGWVDRLAAPA